MQGSAQYCGVCRERRGTLTPSQTSSPIAANAGKGRSGRSTRSERSSSPESQGVPSSRSNPQSYRSYHSETSAPADVEVAPRVVPQAAAGGMQATPRALRPPCAPVGTPNRRPPSAMGGGRSGPHLPSRRAGSRARGMKTTYSCYAPPPKAAQDNGESPLRGPRQRVRRPASTGGCAAADPTAPFLSAARPSSAVTREESAVASLFPADGSILSAAEAARGTALSGGAAASHANGSRQYSARVNYTSSLADSLRTWRYERYGWTPSVPYYPSPHAAQPAAVCSRGEEEEPFYCSFCSTPGLLEHAGFRGEGELPARPTPVPPQLPPQQRYKYRRASAPPPSKLPVEYHGLRMRAQSRRLGSASNRHT